MKENIKTITREQINQLSDVEMAMYLGMEGRDYRVIDEVERLRDGGHTPLEKIDLKEAGIL